MTDARRDELALCAACARGEAPAIAAFERRYFGEIDAALRQLRASELSADELKQALRERLFTARDGRPPRIVDYAGRGDLGRWLRAVALRAALDALRRGGREISHGDDDFADRALPHEDAELALLKARYAADFKLAVRQALAELTTEQRTDLRLYYLEALTLEELAGLHGVAASTVWRRLAQARAAALDATRRIMRERLGLSEADVASILALIESRLELSKSALGE